MPARKDAPVRKCKKKRKRANVGARRLCRRGTRRPPRRPPHCDEQGRLRRTAPDRVAAAHLPRLRRLGRRRGGGAVLRRDGVGVQLRPRGAVDDHGRQILLPQLGHLPPQRRRRARPRRAVQHLPVGRSAARRADASLPRRGGERRLDRAGRHPARRRARRRRRHRRRGRRRYQGRRAVHDRRRQPGAPHPRALHGGPGPPPPPRALVEPPARRPPRDQVRLPLHRRSNCRHGARRRPAWRA